MPSHQTASRLMTALELLQTHGRMSGAVLAARLGVDRRTVRRYVASLEAMGIPLTTERGPEGGYELIAGFRLPPLMFTNDEAMALGLGLAAVHGFGLSGSSSATASARAKLERVMPPEVRRRLSTIVESVAFSAPRQPAAGTAWLPRLASCAERREAVRLAYRPSAGTPGERELDPYGVAFLRGHWYVAGFCHLRRSLRTFRLDRVEALAETGQRFERPAGFDVMAHLVTSIALIPRAHAVEVRLGTDLETASRALLPEIGLLEPIEGGVLLRSQVDDLDWFARELARLPWPAAVQAPAALAAAVIHHARRLADAQVPAIGTRARSRGARASSRGRRPSSRRPAPRRR